MQVCVRLAGTRNLVGLYVPASAEAHQSTELSGLYSDRSYSPTDIRGNRQPEDLLKIVRYVPASE